MKHARRIKVDGETWKWFLDRRAFDEQDGYPFARLILYSPDGKKFFRNFASD